MIQVDLVMLAETLRTRGCAHILCYSGYTYEALRRRARRQPAIGAVLDEIPVVGLVVQLSRKFYFFTLTNTSVARYCFDLADWDNSGWVVPLGASGHPGSTHFADQVAAWSEGRLLPMRYSWDRISQDAATHQRLDPAG